MASNFHRVKLTMCLSFSLPSDWILLDIERCLSTDQIRELAIVTGGEEIRLNHDRLIEAIDRMEQAHVIIGHNLRRHDIPHLYRLAGRQQPEGLEERLCDTLELSSLFLVGKATHSLNKLYREEIGLSDPVEDAIESYEVYQRCQANHSLPILVRYWATRLLPDCYLTNSGHGWGLIEPYDIAMNSSKWETLRLRHPWLNIRGLQAYLEELERSGKNTGHLGAIVFLNWLYHINTPAACRPKWLELKLPTFREAEEHAMSLLSSEPELISELQYFFGPNYRFREGQLEIIQAMLDPGRVPLGILPTGGGKSLTFQLPALILSRRYRGLSIIVSPLQALMEDQVISLKMRLEEKGLQDYSDRVACLTGSQPLSEQKRVIDAIYHGAIDILYLSPERLRQPTIQRLLKRRSPYLWVLDEAHTLSQWGHDFRPDFLRIIQAIQETNPNNRTPRLGFVTATATHKVIEDLQNTIHDLDSTWDLQRVPNDELFQWREEIQTHIEIIEKPQSFSTRDITEVQSSARFKRVLEILSECSQNERLGASENSIGSVAIIYTPTRKMAEIYAQALQSQNYRAEAFHSRVKSSDKKEILQRFKQGELEIVVATNAFGMGIDRAGILTVIHVAPPATPEAYVQEIGRLARNKGEQGHAYLFLDEVEDFQWIFRQQNKSQICGHSLKKCWDIIRGKLNEGQGEAWVSGLDFAPLLGETDLDTIEMKTRVILFYLEKSNLIRQEESYPCVLQITLNCDLSEYIQIHTDRRNQLVIDKILKYLQEIGIRRNGQGIDLDIKNISLDTKLKITQLLRGIRQLVRQEILQWRYEIAFKFAYNSFQTVERQIKAILVSVEAFLSWLENHQDFGDRTMPIYQTLEDELRIKTKNFSLYSAIKTLTILDLCSVQREGKIINFTWKGKEDTFTQWLVNARNVFGREWKYLELIYRNLKDIFQENQWECKSSQLLNIAELESRFFEEILPNSSVTDVLYFMQKLQLISMGRGSIVRETLYHLRRVQKSRWSPRVHQRLQDHYAQRRRRIHAMEKISIEPDERERISILHDYFTLPLKKFDKKYFQAAIVQENFIQSIAYDKILRNLNKTQRRIVKDDTSRALLVLAGPGSGKTHTIVRRIAYLILARGVQPEKIVALAYNRTAAAELRKRLYELLGSQGIRVNACTFHSLAKQLTKLTRGDAPNHFSANDYYNWLLEQATEYIRDHHPGYSYILVDEYQDIDRLKYQMIKALADFKDMDEDQEQTSFLVAVGDDDQNLYEFQGANIEFIRAFTTDYKIEQENKRELIINYRSCPQIIDFANQFITQTIDSNKRMKQHLIQPSLKEAHSGQVWYVEYRDWYSAAEWIVTRIQDIQERDRSLRLDDIAILAHRWEDLRFVQHLLREKELPYQLYSDHEDLRPSNSFVGQKIIEDLQKDLRQMIANPKTHIESIRERLNYGDWDSAWHSLTYQLTDDCSMTSLDIIYLFEAARNYKPNRINLSSFHSAKGTEFKYVFVIEDGIRLNQELPESCARRLYVGFTRAKEELYILVNNVKSCHHSGFTNPSKHPILEIQNFVYNLNIEMVACGLQHKPSEITYQVMLEPKDLYLSHPVIINNQDKIEQYARQGGSLYFCQGFFNLENNSSSAISVLSNDGQQEISKYNQGTYRQFEAHGHTIFRIERDDEWYRRAGVTTDITHHYIVLPRLEVREELA